MTLGLFVDIAPAAHHAKPAITSPDVPQALLEQRDANHLCRVCGLWGAFGFDVALLKGKVGRYACFPHRAQVEGLRS